MCSLLVIAWEMSKQFLYKYQYQCILIFLVVWLGMIRLKHYSFDVDMGIKKKTNRKILSLLFTLLTLYSYMPSERFR